MIIRRGLRFVEDHALVLILVVALLVGVMVPWRLRIEERQRVDAIEEAAVERRSQICDALADGQQTQQALIETVIVSIDSGVLRDRLIDFRDDHLGEDDLPDYCLHGE